MTSDSNTDKIFTLTNRNAMRVTISERGAALVSWWAPDRHGTLADVLLGYSELEEYRTNSCYFGAIVGRWANRIAGASFKIDGAVWQIERNDHGNHLHGGTDGFHRAKWSATNEAEGLRMTLDSPDGDSGFPGNVHCEVLYQLLDDGSLVISYEAMSDAPTPLNLTSHPYFNLNGGQSNIEQHELMIASDHYLKIDKNLIPIKSASVAAGPFDFRQPASIGPRLKQPDSQLVMAGGFDHCYCLGSCENGVARKVAHVNDPSSGRQLTVSTTAAGLQFYSGNYLDGTIGRGKLAYANHDGFCLEAQAFPNQINNPDPVLADAVILRPGQTYRQTTIYKLSVGR
jgi:aldose 1-epimerase